MVPYKTSMKIADAQRIKELLMSEQMTSRKTASPRNIRYQSISSKLNFGFDSQDKENRKNSRTSSITSG